MQRIIKMIKRSGWRTKCAVLAFVVLNCFAVSVWIHDPNMWAVSLQDGGWQVAIAQLTLGLEACLLLLAAGLTCLFIAINSH